MDEAEVAIIVDAPVVEAPTPSPLLRAMEWDFFEVEFEEEDEEYYDPVEVGLVDVEVVSVTRVHLGWRCIGP